MSLRYSKQEAAMQERKIKTMADGLEAIHQDLLRIERLLYGKEKEEIIMAS